MKFLGRQKASQKKIMVNCFLDPKKVLPGYVREIIRTCRKIHLFGAAHGDHRLKILDDLFKLLGSL